MGGRLCYDRKLGRYVVLPSLIPVIDLSHMGIAWFFTAVSTVQMLIWAQKKHKAYKREFGKEFPRGRKAMIPFLF